MQSPHTERVVRTTDSWKPLSYYTPDLIIIHTLEKSDDISASNSNSLPVYGPVHAYRKGRHGPDHIGHVRGSHGNWSFFCHLCKFAPPPATSLPQFTSSPHSVYWYVPKTYQFAPSADQYPTPVNVSLRRLTFVVIV